LIIGEGPGEFEDERNRQFIGNAGSELVRLVDALGINLRQDCWLYNAIQCRATEHGKNRNPTTDEINYCRPNVIELINKLKPERIICLGKYAVQSVCWYAWTQNNKEYTDDGAMSKWAGWQIPSTRLNAWICPTYHPSFVLRNGRPDRGGFIPNKATAPYVQDHLEAAFALKGRPHPIRIPDYRRQVGVFHDPGRAVQAIRVLMSSGKMLSFDYETDRLKPDHKDARIVCASISDGKSAVAFPWTGGIVRVFQEFIKSDIPKCGANIAFEERWTWKLLGCGVRNWQWDTMLGAHWRNCQHGICGLKFQAFVHLGVPDYSSHLDSLLKDSQDSNSPNKIDQIALDDLMLYCGLDSLYEWLVAEKQMKGLRL
jgi:uracil-DNA glycosylase family 4